MNDTGLPMRPVHDLAELEAEYAQARVGFQPWLDKDAAVLAEQAAIQQLLAGRCKAKFGRGAFVARDARILAHRFELGAGSWVAGGAIVRGDVTIGAESTVNPYAHIAGKVTIGAGVRIAGMVSIYGFNHGFERTDVPIYRQPQTQKGVVIGDGTWIGANAVVLDGVEIGAHCIVAAGAVVTRSVPDYQVVGGNPARVIRDRREAEAAAAPVTPAAAVPAGRVRSLLFDQDPYVALERTFPVDMQGWASTEPVFRALIEELKPKLIVEVGTWKGASAIHMAGICKELGLGAEIVCVDTWLGNWQHWSRKDGVGSRADLKLVNGYPTLYFQFLSNVVASGFQSVITPLPLTGIAGAKLLAHHAVSPDLIYIDGDHEYESVIADLQAWTALAPPHGVVLGDDYNWPGVRRAVAEIVAEGRWRMELAGGKFVLRRVATA